MNQSSDASVEDRLQAYGQVLEREIDRTPATRQPSHRSAIGWRVAIAAAVVAVLAGGSVTLTRMLDRTEVVATDPTTADELTVPEPAPPVGVEPAPDGDSFSGSEACAAEFEALDDRALAGAIEDSFDPRAETVERVVLALPDSPGAVRVLLLGNESLVSCRVNRSSLTVADLGVGSRDWSQLPQPDEILLVDQHWSSATESGQTGPGDMGAVGLIGADVAAVWVGLPDGTALPALLDGKGWFAVDGQIPQDVPLFEETYYWRLTDGSIHSAPADTLDEESPDEQCAAIPGCIEQRVAELQAEAATEGLDRQADALADGLVDQTELRAGVDETVECLVAAGLDAETLDNGTGLFVNYGEDDPRDSLDIQQACSHRHSDLISELHRLREAEAQLAGD